MITFIYFVYLNKCNPNNSPSFQEMNTSCPLTNLLTYLFTLFLLIILN